MKTKHYKEIAEQMGDGYAKRLAEMEYFRFDSGLNNFVKVRPIEGKDPASFKDARQKMKMEQMLVAGVMPYIAFITAPDKIAADDVIGSNWEQTRIQIDNLKKYHRVETDGYGFSGKVSDEDAVQNYMMFHEGFKIISCKIENVLPKIEVVKEDDLVNQMISDAVQH